VGLDTHSAPSDRQAKSAREPETAISGWRKRVECLHNFSRFHPERPTMSANKYLAAATAHFHSLGMPSTTIPEWTVDGKPVKVFWKPLTCDDQEQIRRQGDGTDIHVFMMKALDEKGERMFTLDDKRSLQIMVAPQIITRVAMKMMELPKVEDLEKN
jgi:hypothetical protein